MKAFVVVACVLAAAACSDRSGDGRERREPMPPPRERRVIDPPVGIVRPLPPHAIRADGVGPFRLGDKLSDLLQQLPSGPRIVVFEVPGLVHRSLIRAEESMVLIGGGEPSGVATAVSVVAPGVARTESGVRVGATRDEVLRALGPPLAELDRAVDPRMVIPTSLPNARILIEDGKVATITVTSDAPTTAPRGEGGCPRPAARGRAIGACLTGAGELVETVGNEVTVRPPEGERPITSFKVPSPIVFAAPLRAADGRDELAVVMHDADADTRKWSLIVYRFDAGKITRVIDPTPLYQLSSANARWIGTDVDRVSLYLELVGRPEAIEVGGLLTTRPEADGFPDVVVISPVSVPRRASRAAPGEAGDAGPSDAASPAASDAGAEEAKP